MAVKKNGTMVEISLDLIPTNKPYDKLPYETPLIHVNRVRKAMLMHIEEMRMNPNWIAYLESKPTGEQEGTSEWLERIANTEDIEHEEVKSQIGNKYTNKR